MKKKLFLLHIILILTQIVLCQDTDKTFYITVSGSGKTLEDAKNNAIRSALDQAILTFIGNNQELIKEQFSIDTIRQFSNGTIKSFTILSQTQLPNLNFAITIRAIVSLNKLVTQAKSTGISIEINGGTFASNIKQQLLNEQSEVRAVNEMIGLLHEPLQISFNYKLKVSNPKSIDSESKNWKIPILVSVVTNSNFDICVNYFIKTLSAVSLSLNEIKDYQDLNKKIYPVVINYKGVSKKIYLRKQNSLDLLNTFLDQWQFYNKLFSLKCGQDELTLDYIQRITEINNNIYSSGSMVINFLSVGQESATFSMEDNRTLNEIEKISEYNISPKGIISKFKYGGLVVYEKDGHGLVCSISDFGNMDWNSAKIFCEELVLNFYADWKLPSLDDLKYIYNDLFKNQIGGIKSKYYWSSNETYDTKSAYYKIFSNGESDHTNKSTKFNFRAVRYF